MAALTDIGEPNLTELLEQVVETSQREARVCLPGVVTSVDQKRARVDVQPSIKDAINSKYDPVVTDVPIVYPQGGGASITFPIDEGDDVLLVFADRSLENWLTAGGGSEVDNTDPRQHDLTDCFAIPISLQGLNNNRLDDLSISFEGGEFHLDSSGNATVEGVTTVNLGENANQAVLRGTVVAAAFTAMGAAVASAYSTWQATSPPTTDSNGAFITALAAAWVALTTTILTPPPGWASLKSKTE